MSKEHKKIIESAPFTIVNETYRAGYIVKRVTIGQSTNTNFLGDYLEEWFDPPEEELC